MEKNKEYITISDNISIYPVIFKLHKTDLFEDFIYDKTLRTIKKLPLITIREFIRLKMIFYAYNCINEQRQGFSVTF